MAHNKKEEQKNCFICNKVLIKMFITYMPYNDNLCGNHCLVEYRKYRKL